jgi:hypothetical protein
MFASLRIITLPESREAERDALAERLHEAAAALPGVRSLWVAPVSREAVINAGHVVWRMTFETERQAELVTLDPAWVAGVAPLLAGAQVTSVGYHVTRSHVRPAGAGIWRALLFRVMPHGFPDEVRKLEQAMLLMPSHVPAIRNWALNTVSTVEGPKAYTHVWEQEYDTLEGLTVDYMVHSIHWGLVDAWYDAEYPNYIVDPALVQVVGRIDRTIMG